MKTFQNIAALELNVAEMANILGGNYDAADDYGTEWYDEYTIDATGSVSVPPDQRKPLRLSGKKKS